MRERTTRRPWRPAIGLLAAIIFASAVSCRASESREPSAPAEDAPAGSASAGAASAGAAPAAAEGAPTPVNEVSRADDDANSAKLSEDPSLDEVMLDLMRATRKSFAALDVGGYRVVVEGTEERAKSVASRTVKPVAAALAKQFFEKSPRKGIRLVLFTSDGTYRMGAKALAGVRPDTPFGFYSSALSAVIMNLSTGGGTLVHEMVHTFTETDFPAMPAWANEGLASLYEQCRIRPSKLVGLTNWRLPALQERLRKAEGEGEGVVERGHLARVVATSTDAFYGARSGLNYAVARYLCYDLQQKGLLEKFYKEFRRDCRKDPTGRKTLERLLGAGLDEYEPGWIERTLALRFP